MAIGDIATCELEITDLDNYYYVREGILELETLGRSFAWLATRKPAAGRRVRHRHRGRSGAHHRLPRGGRLAQNSIDAARLETLATAYKENTYGYYLMVLARAQR
jgi:glucose-1-phosphate thymidylyltransferase